MIGTVGLITVRVRRHDGDEPFPVTRPLRFGGGGGCILCGEEFGGINGRETRGWKREGTREYQRAYAGTRALTFFFICFSFGWHIFEHR